jgi:hypothetical protein
MIKDSNNGKMLMTWNDVQTTLLCKKIKLKYSPK